MMPYKNKEDRNYRHEYDAYQGTAEQRKNRAKRNAARRALEKTGKVKKGDGKDVDHVLPLSKGGGNLSSNLRVKSAHANRSYDRNSDHSVAKKK
jgi:hypothetical protein